MSELDRAYLRRLTVAAEARLRDDLHDSLATFRRELEQLVADRVGELEQRLEGVHREALKVLTNHYARKES